MLQFKFVPIQRWPGQPTKERVRSPFRAGYVNTLNLLEAELSHLRAKEIILQAWVSWNDIRNDDHIRSDARVTDPGVILTFDKHYVGMQRVREYVAAMKNGTPFTVQDVYMASIAHRGHGDQKYQHPDFERQRKSSITLALSSMAKAADLEVVKQGRGREHTVYRRAEVK